MDITKVINERNIEAIDDSFEINLENAPDIDPKHLMMTPIYYSPEQKQRRFQVSPSRNDYKNLPNSKPSLRRNLFSLEDAYVSPSKPKDEKISEDEPSFTQLSPIKAKPPPKAKRSRNNAFRHEDGSYKIRKLAELLHVERDGKRVCSFWLVAWAGSTYKDWTWEPAANLTYGSLWLLKMKYARIIKKTNWVTPPVVVQKNKQCKYKLVAHSSMHMNKIKELLKLYTTGTRMMKDLVKQGEEYTEDLSRFYINQEKRKKWKEENNRFEGQNEHVKRQRERSASPEV